MLCSFVLPASSKESVPSLMVLSLLLEWNCLSGSALEAAQKALSIIESSEDRFEPSGVLVWNMAKLNVARLLW